MKLKTLIKKANREFTWNYFKTLKNVNSENRELFDTIWDKLLSLKPITQPEFTIFMEYVEDCEGGINESYYSISARKKGETQMNYCLMYDKWENWLGMNIDLNDPRTEGGIWEINFFLAQVLWEMTWLGFDYETVTKKIEMSKTKFSYADEDWDDEL